MAVKFKDYYETLGVSRGASDDEIRNTLEEAHRGITRTISLRTSDGKTKSIRVNIPAGASSGQLIRIANEGAPGAGGGPPGDLFLTVRIEPHPLFKIVDDANLEL